MASTPKLPRETSYQRLFFFLAQRFIRDSLTLFEIPFFMLLAVKTDMSKILKKFSCFVFFFGLVSQYCSYVFIFNIPYLSITQYLKNLYILCSLSLVKKRYIHQRCTWISLVSESNNSNFEIFENVSFKNHYESKGEKSWYCFVITYIELLESKFILHKLSL